MKLTYLRLNSLQAMQAKMVFLSTTTLKGNTTQSSNYIDGTGTFSSDRAIDGNMSTCAHTNKTVDSWWRIDLLGVYNISCIAIYNIKHNNANITGAQIFIGNSREIHSLNSTETNTYNYFHFNGEAVGRYVLVFTPVTNFTVLCDVKIWGSLKGATRSDPQNYVLI
uniref:Fucolectin tachylectin-4 pentraxin-1 domain-containing protein n=1 Tax=Seriola lalandi dorsalis TaxID=1841481 RepID=A0A3B4XM34_SERLL